MTKKILLTNKIALYALLIAILCTACDTNITSSKVIAIPNQLWYYKDSLVFENNIHKTTPQQDIIISIRNTYNYPYQNLFLKINMTSPKGEKIISDTLQLRLADKFGNWKGEGWGYLRINEIALKTNYTFQDTGKYTISIKHLMRDDHLTGIEDIAISFQKNGTAKLKGEQQTNENRINQTDTTQRKDATL